MEISWLLSDLIRNDIQKSLIIENSNYYLQSSIFYFLKQWRWRELNPRPESFFRSHYMFSSSMNFTIGLTVEQVPKSNQQCYFAFPPAEQKSAILLCATFLRDPAGKFPQKCGCYLLSSQCVIIVGISTFTG